MTLCAIGPLLNAFAMSIRTIHRFGLALGVVLTVGAATGLTVCDLLFGCGCEPLWAGSSAHCDINVAGLPDCPVCAGSAARRVAVGGVVGFAIVGAMGGVARKTGAGTLALVVVGTLAYGPGGDRRGLRRGRC